MTLVVEAPAPMVSCFASQIANVADPYKVGWPSSVAHCCCCMSVQAITEEIERLQADVKNHDDLKRQLEECMAYQKNVNLEKALQARHAKAGPIAHFDG